MWVQLAKFDGSDRWSRTDGVDMPHLNLDLEYFTHRKTRRLVGRLGRGAELLPLKLWSYVGKHHAENGELAGYAASEIESIAEWCGKPGDMVEAMLDESIMFLERTEDGFIVHGWLEHQGHIAVFKERGRAMANRRWDAARNAIGIPNSNADPPDKQCSDGADGANETNGEKKTPKPPLPDGFSKFWDAWPEHDRKASKAACLKVWERKRLEAKTVEVLAVLEAFKASASWAENGGQYIPGPLPWLNQDKFETPIKAIRPKGLSSGPNNDHRTGEFQQAAPAIRRLDG